MHAYRQTYNQICILNRVGYSCCAIIIRTNIKHVIKCVKLINNIAIIITLLPRSHFRGEVCSLLGSECMVMGWHKKQNSMGFKKCVCLKIDPFSYLQFSRCINCLSSFSPSKRPFGGNYTLFLDQTILKTFHQDVFPCLRCLFP